MAKTQMSINIDCKNLAPIINLSQKITRFQRMKLGIYLIMVAEKLLLAECLL